MTFERITADPEIMASVPCTRGTQIPVATVMAVVAEGAPTACGRRGRA